MPDSVTCIGDYTFVDCTSITSIAIPRSVNSIGVMGHFVTAEAWPLLHFLEILLRLQMKLSLSGSLHQPSTAKRARRVGVILLQVGL
ncbi:MAG: hypothetical protein ACJ0HK_02275 [Akkermansiaceae bacterium]